MSGTIDQSVAGEEDPGAAMDLFPVALPVPPAQDRPTSSSDCGEAPVKTGAVNQPLQGHDGDLQKKN